MHASDETTDCLFVYGTLMPQSRHPMAMRLAAESTDMGPATICGQLYNLGAYPGVLPSADPHDRVYGNRVHGVIMKLHRPPHSLRWIDTYEGCGDHDAEPYGFERVIVPARQMARRQLPVWVYYYRGLLGNARRLQSGRYYPAKSLVRLRS